MQDYPHQYVVSASGAPDGELLVSAEGLADIPSMPPPQFDGPGGYWSPEDLLVASIADCLILTFRAVARASRFEWHSLSCDVEGILDRVDNITCFTDFIIRATLHVPAGANLKKAERLVEKSESVCLVTNSLTGNKHVSVTVVEDANV